MLPDAKLDRDQSGFVSRCQCHRTGCNCTGLNLYFFDRSVFWLGCGGGLVVSSGGDPGFDSCFLQTFSLRILQCKFVYYEHVQLIGIKFEVKLNCISFDALVDQT